MEQLLSILSGGAAGAALVWLLRGWISERLQQSIRHEYSQKLETHKADLNARIQAIQHENQLQQLRTSLFFDHQRNAFAGLLAKVAEVNQKWLDEGQVAGEGLTCPVPADAYKDLWRAYYQHQLFLDSPCLAAMELVLEYYAASLPEDDGCGPPRMRDPNPAYDGVEYLQPRIAEMFQSRIGVIARSAAEKEIALLGAIRLLNGYHFPDVQLPPKGPLQLTHRDRPSEAVAKAEDNIATLVATLSRLQEYLRQEGGLFHEAALKSARYLAMLKPYCPSPSA